MGLLLLLRVGGGPFLGYAKTLQPAHPLAITLASEPAALAVPFGDGAGRCPSLSGTRKGGLGAGACRGWAPAAPDRDRGCCCACLACLACRACRDHSDLFHLV